MNKLKNHITPKGKRLAQVLSNKFGVTLADFENALSGDLKAAEKIGELAKQGHIYSEYASKFAQMYSEIISGSEAYNRALSEILGQAGRSAIAIDKEVSKTLLANQRYEHQRKELALDFVQSRSAEKNRHNYELNFSQIKGYIDAHLVSVDNRASMVEQSHRTEVKQIAADEQMQKRHLNEALNRGDDARYDLIPEKNYTGGIKEKLLALKSAFGF